ncbi:hypothetical protein [Maribellus maritimus]|nr:hypothetical protein [Maribellus maritimus]
MAPCHELKIQKVKPWHFAQSDSDAKTNSGIVPWSDNLRIKPEA